MKAETWIKLTNKTYGQKFVKFKINEQKSESSKAYLLSGEKWMVIIFVGEQPGRSWRSCGEKIIPGYTNFDGEKTGEKRLRDSEVEVKPEKLKFRSDLKW